VAGPAATADAKRTRRHSATTTGRSASSASRVLIAASLATRVPAIAGPQQHLGGQRGSLDAELVAEELFGGVPL
jgi:hypothetical protein